MVPGQLPSPSVLNQGRQRRERVPKTEAEVARQGRGREARPYPLCYYLYGIEKHARSNQHEILNCFAYFCSPHGTDCARCCQCQDPHVSTLSLPHTLFLTSALFCKDAQSFFFSFLFFFSPFPWMLINSQGNKELLPPARTAATLDEAASPVLTPHHPASCFLSLDFLIPSPFGTSLGFNFFFFFSNFVPLWIL